LGPPTPGKQNIDRLLADIAKLKTSLNGANGGVGCRFTPGWKQLTPRVLSALETKM